MCTFACRLVCTDVRQPAWPGHIYVGPGPLILRSFIVLPDCSRGFGGRLWVPRPKVWTRRLVQTPPKTYPHFLYKTSPHPTQNPYLENRVEYPACPSHGTCQVKKGIDLDPTGPNALPNKFSGFMVFIGVFAIGFQIGFGKVWTRRLAQTPPKTYHPGP